MRDERLATLRSQFDDATETLTILRDGKQVARGQLDQPDRPPAHRAVHRRLHEGRAARGPEDRARARPQLLRRGGQVRAHRQPGERARVRAHAGPADRSAALPRQSLHRRRGAVGRVRLARQGRCRSGRRGSPCSARTQRCDATNVDPATGARDMAIPAWLQRSLGHSDFGIYAKVVTGGELAPGAPVVPPVRRPSSSQPSAKRESRDQVKLLGPGYFAARNSGMTTQSRGSSLAGVAGSGCSRPCCDEPDGAGTRAARAAAGSGRGDAARHHAPTAGLCRAHRAGDPGRRRVGAALDRLAVAISTIAPIARRSPRSPRGRCGGHDRGSGSGRGSDRAGNGRSRLAS